TPSSAGYTSRKDSMSANARIGKTMRWAAGRRTTGGPSASSRRGSPPPSSVGGRASGRLHRLDDPAERVALAGHLGDRPRDEDVGAGLRDRLRVLRRPDATAYDEGDVDRFAHGPDDFRGHRFRGSAPGL